jgi:hypothetical protein
MMEAVCISETPIGLYFYYRLHVAIFQKALIFILAAART